MPEAVPRTSSWSLWITEVEVSHAAHSKLLSCSGQCTKKSLEYSCPWIPLHIFLYQKDLSKADLKTTPVLAACEASPFPEVAEMCSVWALVAFPKQWVHVWDVCSPYRVLCCCSVAIRRHLKHFFFFRIYFFGSLYLPSTFLPISSSKKTEVVTRH